MTGKTVLITGASSGIGKVTARELVRAGARVVMLCREGAKADAVLREIRKATGVDEVEMMNADLSSQGSIRAFVGRFKERYDRLDVLVNNAGMMYPDRRVTVDGLELTFALNHLAYFLLTDLLLDMLKASAPARVVNVSSEAHRRVGAIDFEDLQMTKGYGPWRAYGQSKLANILFTHELARRLEGTRVTANCLHPGFVATGFARDATGVTKVAMAVLRGLVMITPEKGALTSIYLASSPQVEAVSGKYFIRCRPASSSAAANDPAAARRLWEASVRLTTLPA